MWARSKRLLLAWFDNQALPASGELDRRIEWLRTLPFIGMHVMCLGAIWVGVSTTAVVVAVAMYVVRMIAITGFYHRYFSHSNLPDLAGGAVRAGAVGRYLCAARSALVGGASPTPPPALR